MRRLTGLLTLTVVTTLSACGSDDDRLTSEEFLEQGNAIRDASKALLVLLGRAMHTRGTAA